MSDESVLHISVLQVFYYYYFFSTLIVCFLGPRCSCSLGEQFLSLSGRPGVWHIPIRLKKFQHLLTSGLKEDVCTCECVWRWWRVLVVVVGGGEAVSMVTPHRHPHWVLKDKASHTHMYTHAHGALQGQLSQINISPHLKNRIQRMAFQRPDYSRALDLGFLH